MCAVGNFSLTVIWEWSRAPVIGLLARATTLALLPLSKQRRRSGQRRARAYNAESAITLTRRNPNANESWRNGVGREVGGELTPRSSIPNNLKGN